LSFSSFFFLSLYFYLFPFVSVPPYLLLCLFHVLFIFVFHLSLPPALYQRTFHLVFR
jgi:hypothetical protein